MANFISFLADLTDPTFATREVDLNAYEIGSGPFETDTDTLDLGAPSMDGVWLSEAGKDEDVLSAHRRGRVEASFDLRIGPRATNSLPNLTTALQNLNRALDRSGVWVLQQPGLTTPLYIDYYPSPLIQQLMPGERSMFHLWTQLQQPNGMRVTIIRRPKMRGAALDAEVNLAHNPLMAEDHDADSIPTYWQWDSVTGLTFPGEGYDWTYGAHEVLLATSSERFFYQEADAGAVVAGTAYSFAIDVAASYSALPTVRARIDWLDISDVIIGSSVYSSSVALLFGPRTAFARPTISNATAPTGAVGARYGISFDDADANPMHAWIRNAQLEQGATASAFRVGFETVSNDVTQPFGKRAWFLNTANADALGQLRAAPDADGEIAVMTYARRSGARDSAMAMRYAPGWHGVDSNTLLNGTTDVSGQSDTISGHAAKSALTDDAMKSILRHEMIPAEESALRGTWRLHVALRGDLGDVYKFEGRYGLGDVVDLPRTMTLANGAPGRRRLDLTNPPAQSVHYDVDLGFVRIPANAVGLYFELWGMRVTTDDSTGTGELYIDQFWPEPVDDDLAASLAIPGARTPGVQTETIVGEDLDTPPDGLTDDPVTADPFLAGTVYNTDLLLNDEWEACGIPLGWTDDLTPGVEHTYVATVTMYTAGEKYARRHGELRVHDLTSDTQVGATVLRNEKGVAWSQRSFKIRFTPTAAHAYLVYIVDQMVTADGNIHVENIQHSFEQPVDGAADQTIAVDADQRRAYVLHNEQFANDLDLTSGFPMLMPKVQLYRFSLSGLGPNGSDDVLDGRVAFRHDPARTARLGMHSIQRTFN